ncbi:MAG: succinyl-diaminopimelate desuccinylase [Planctomycetes bacterium]|nr:succinyl-diaminopimelate desuccinylase [Planctomycetota bacterium]
MTDLERVLALCESLLAIPSVTGEEAAIADWLERRLQPQAPDTLLRAGNSLCVAPRAFDQRKPTLMLVGHTDTVPQLDDNPVRRDGDRLYGLGASDMKAADAVLLDVIEQSRVREPRFNLVGVLYAREEGPYAASEMPLIHAAAREWFERTDLAVCMEPTDNALELGCVGTLHAEVVFTGRRAHSARPWQGENAIHKAAPFLGRLAALKREPHEFHGLVFYEVLSATMVDFRGARNVVPDRFQVNVNYRFAPGKVESELRARLDSLVGDAGSYTIVDLCPAGRVCGDNPLLAALHRAAGSMEVRAKQAWTDVGRLSQMGIDAINWGPGATAQAHQAGEWVSIEAVARSRSVLESWVFEAPDAPQG